jgi:hypothetical protein
MSETRLDLAGDLQDALDMANGLAEYLRGSQLYGSIGGGLFSSGKKPALTLGALLMRLRRLRALQEQLSPAQQAVLHQVEAIHTEMRGKWRMHYDDKLMREAHSRLDAMRTFFEECAQSPRQCAGAYLPEALRRTVAQEISLVLDADETLSEDLVKKMRDIDSRLRRYVRASAFVWAEELSEVYPKDVFWWLYFCPPAEANDRA